MSAKRPKSRQRRVDPRGVGMRSPVLQGSAGGDPRERIDAAIETTRRPDDIDGLPEGATVEQIAAHTAEVLAALRRRGVL